MNNIHSVESHLRLDISEYDRIIRTFIPGYDAMLSTILAHLANALQENATIIDLGGGTGSLACCHRRKISCCADRVVGCRPENACRR